MRDDASVKNMIEALKEKLEQRIREGEEEVKVNKEKNQEGVAKFFLDCHETAKISSSSFLFCVYIADSEIKTAHIRNTSAKDIMCGSFVAEDMLNELKDSIVMSVKSNFIKGIE